MKSFIISVPGPEVIKLFFILKSTEHENSTAHKTKIPTNVHQMLYLSC